MGVQREVDIEDLQPSDGSFKTQTLLFLEDLSKGEILALSAEEPIQIWELDGRRVISDGHNRLGELYKRGVRRIIVDYNNWGKDVEIYFGDELRRLVQEAREKGIYSLADLWAA